MTKTTAPSRMIGWCARVTAQLLTKRKKPDNPQVGDDDHHAEE